MNTTTFFVFLLGAIFVVSCKNEVCNCPTDEVTQKSNDSISVFANKFWRENKFWENSNEPYLDSVKYETYRICLTNPLEEYVKIIRIEETENGYQLISKRYCDNYLFDIRQGTLPSENIVRPLSREEWSKITNKINENCFWTMKIDEEEGCLNCGGSLFMEGQNPTINCPNIASYHIFGTNCRTDSLTEYKYWQFCDMIFDLDK